MGSDYRERLEAVVTSAAERGIATTLITPGANLEYLTGYRGSITTERITALVLTAGREPVLLVPRLEQPLAEWAMADGAALPIVTWADGEDSTDRLLSLLPPDTRRLAVEPQMWFTRVSDLVRRLPGLEVSSAGPELAALRTRKNPAEVSALAEAAAAIDAVHASVAHWLRPGRTEREVAADIAAAILDTGHRTVEFVIVASGPNSASPHAEPTDRPIGRHEPVVVDIGGRMPSGYNSDCTRTYVLGRPTAAYEELYGALHAAQLAQCEAVAPGVSAEELDAVGRRIIEAAGFGEHFVHRTGHGIGLEVHEEPYIVAGSARPLDVGATFSVEPGIYLAGVGGGRIEDIVVCEPDGGRRLNRGDRALQIIER